GLGLALGGAAAQIGACAWAVAKAADDDQMQCPIGLPVAAVVQAVTRGLAGGRRDRTRAAQRGERRLAAEPFNVLPGGHEQLAGVAGRDAEQLSGARRGS